MREIYTKTFQTAEKAEKGKEREKLQFQKY